MGVEAGQQVRVRLLACPRPSSMFVELMCNCKHLDDTHSIISFPPARFIHCPVKAGDDGMHESITAIRVSERGLPNISLAHKRLSKDIHTVPSEMRTTSASRGWSSMPLWSPSSTVRVHERALSKPGVCCSGLRTSSTTFCAFCKIREGFQKGCIKSRSLSAIVAYSNPRRKCQSRVSAVLLVERPTVEHLYSLPHRFPIPNLIEQ